MREVWNDTTPVTNTQTDRQNTDREMRIEGNKYRDHIYIYTV